MSAAVQLDRTEGFLAESGDGTPSTGEKSKARPR
jgi:hypothetical protein